MLFVRTDHFSGAVLGTFRRRRLPVLIVFPAPSWGLSGAGDYLYLRTDRFPALSWGLSGAHLFHFVCSYLCAW